MDLLLLLQFDGFSKQSDLNKALIIGFGAYFSGLSVNRIKDEYNSDEKDEKKPIKGYPWFYMFIHLVIVIQIYYSMKKGTDKDLRGGCVIGMIMLFIHCFMLHTSHSNYVSKKEKIIQKKKEEEEERRRYLEQRKK